MVGNETSKQFLPTSTDFSTLENMLQDPCAMPVNLPMDFLKAITRDFSEEQELGRGGFGVVYKGVLRNGKTIAVKKLSEIHLDDAQFQREVTYLIGLKHQNIVQLVGYCAESRWEATPVNGNYVMAEIRKRLLCFEYLNNKSLDKHLSAESCGLEWHRRYEIIKGICCGLHYLHMECHIIHLDLKPENILLDDNMVPKIADFGLSRLFGQQQSRIITESRGGTLGYMAPEYINHGLLSIKSDIFSLGVIIIELMTGSRDSSSRMCDEPVVRKWRDRLEKTPRYIPFEIYSQQVTTCIVLGLNCVDHDPKKRPAALEIIQMLNDVESMNQQTSESQISTVSNSALQTPSIQRWNLAQYLNRASISRTINISSVFTSAKGMKISILCFEVANTIFMASILMTTLSKHSMKHLNESVLLSEGVRRLISKDHNHLLVLAEASIREEFRRLSTEVVRFGNLAQDPLWHNLDIYFHRVWAARLKSELAPRKNLNYAAISGIQYLIKLVQRTAELYREMSALDALETLYIRTEDPSASDVIHSSVKNQRNVVKNLKKKSLWCKTTEDILEKLVDIMIFMHFKINSAFLKNDGDQSEKLASNLCQTLGPDGSALHYANVILQINTLTTVAEARAEMGRILQWLVPVAESTRLYYKNGAFGKWEWAMKGMEAVDGDEMQWSGPEERQIIVSAMITHENAKANKMETLYYADKERTEGYILDLICALHCLVC
ncbi:protein PSK SIMULATOR 1-like [Phragmites australis]|uniref:protein PSK SIMULATOR 1-like n=1 Tax=Phragmites australis TaxID=29695 RepID=UPI002D786E34|nr:protein PSK SIMULATOR 1-like [Phragmites australis]